MHDQIGLPIVHEDFELLSTVWGGNIRYECRDVRQRSDGIQIDTDNERSFWHVSFGDLKPSSWGRTQIDNAFRLGEEIIFSVQVDKLATRGRQLALQKLLDLGSLTKLNELGILALWRAYRTYRDALYLSFYRVYPS